MKAVRSYVALGVVVLFLGLAVQPAVAGPKPDDFPDETDARDGRELAAPFRELPSLVAALKADTTDPTDSDGDGLPDSVEWVIGTDPLNNDTDFDHINDSREIELQLDPKSIDSNRDGLADYFEAGSVSLDLDGDGVSNAWDWDNDNDGVVDSIDLSPFAKTGTGGRLSLAVNSSGKPTYINLQLRNKNPANMRLLEQTWDWPWDNQSLMQDLDNSKADLTVAPMLEIETSEDIDPLAVAEYGIFVSGRTAYLPLLPVWDDGNTVALLGKMFIPGLGGPANLSLNLSLIWKVTGQSDRTVYGFKAPNGKYVCVNLTGAVRANASTLTDDGGLEIIDAGDGRVLLRAANGMYVRQPSSGPAEATAWDIDVNCEFIKEARGAGSIALKSAYNARYLIVQGDGTVSASAGSSDATAFGLTGPWYRPVPTNLATYPEDFMLTGLSIEENHGSDIGAFYGGDVANLTAANLLLAQVFLRNGTNGVFDMPSYLAGLNISFQSKTASFDHSDQAVVATTGKGLKDMISTLPDHRILPIINIIEDRSAVVELSELQGASYIKGMSLMADVGAQKVATSKTLKTNWYDTDNDTYVETHGIMREISGWGLPKDSFLLLAVLSLAWNTGERTVTNVGSEQMEFQLPDLEQMTDIAFNIVSNGLVGLGEGWKAIEKFAKYEHQLKVARQNAAFDRLVSRVVDNLDLMEDVSLEYVWKVVDTVDSGGLKWLNRIGKVLGVIGYFVDIGIALFTLIAMGCASGWSMSGTWSAVLTATLSLTYGLAVGWIAGMLSMAGPAGWVFAGVFLLAVAFAEVFSWLCGGNSWAEALIQKFLGTMTKQIQRSKVALDVAGQELKIDDKDHNGLDVGDRVTYDCDFDGTVTAMRYTTAILNHHWWQWEDLQDSYILPGMLVFDPMVGFVSRGELFSIGTTSYQYPSHNQWANRTTRFNTSQFVDFTSPCVNYPFITALVYAFRYYYEDCFAFIYWWCDREDYTSAKSEFWNTFQYDVLPGSIDDFAAWRSITSQDADGDGLNNTAETGSDRWLWDTDADGLGDNFEQVIGTSPQEPDSDQDGLDDGLEVQQGTNASCKDTDGDGLGDGTEYRGWVVNFNYSGRKFHWQVAPDPRLNDTDADGLGDYDEYCLGLNPVSADTDGDGVPDPLDYRDHRITYRSTFQKPSGSLGASPILAMERDIDGNTYACIAIDYDRYILKYNPDGTIDSTRGSLGYVLDIAVDGGKNLYVLWVNGSAGETQLDKYDPAGTCIGQIPTCSTAVSMAIDDANGFIYYTDGENGVISKYFISNGTQASSWMPEGCGPGHYNWGRATVDGKGCLYVADPVFDCIFKFAPNGTELGRFNQSAFGAYLYPRDVAVDSEGYIYVVESSGHRIQKLDPRGQSLVAFGSLGTGNSNLSGPSSIAVGGGSVYVADSLNHRIQNLSNEVYFLPPCETFNFTDTDEDGLTDVFENAGWKVTVDNATGHFSYNVTSDPLLNDTDGDGLLDGSERDTGTDPRRADTDGDGESDYDEVWGGGRAVQGRATDRTGCGGRAGQATDPLEWDTDGDGLGDGVEVTFESDPTNNDTDGDGLPDNDEFGLGADPNSNDTDLDGLDDLAEAEFGSGILTPDGDGDCLFDGAEYRLGTDPNSNDTDEDGLIEVLEMIYGTDPKDPDTDDDGLPDGYEIEHLLNATCNDTDHDNVSDAEELARGLNPFSKDSDGDRVPDELDLDCSLVLDGEVVLVMDQDVPAPDFAEVLAAKVALVNATPRELLDKHRTAPYLVIVGRPDAENGTAGAVVRDLLKDTGEVYDAMLSGVEHMAVRYGVWSPTQTIVLLSAADEYDALKTLSLLKSMKMTVTQNSIHAEYLNPCSCFLQDFMEPVHATNAAARATLEAMVGFNVTITGYGRQDTPAVLAAGRGLEAGDVAMDKYLEVQASDNIWSEGVDLILGGQVKLFYTTADLDRTGDGDACDPEDLDESTLSLYWYNETGGSWSVISDAMEWVNGTGLNTTNISLYGREYAGCIWADVERLSLFGIGGLVNGGLPVVARAGEDIDVLAGDEVRFDGSRSTGNGPILNFSWTFSCENRTVTLFGPLASFVFQMPGSYTVTLTVRDSLGLAGSDALTLTVRARPGGKWVLRVGPVTDENGTALLGALVKLIVGSETFSNTTDSLGMALFELGPELVSKGVKVIVTKEGYIPAEYSTNITAARKLERGPPPLVWIRPGERFSLTVGPVKDTDGKTLEEAQVTITVGGQSYTNATDAQGSTSFVLPLTLLGKDINVKIDMKGYNAVEYNTRISAYRALDQDPPAMKKLTKPTGGGGEGVPAWALGVAAIAIALMVLLAAVFMRRKPPTAAGEGHEGGEKPGGAVEVEKEGPPPVPPGGRTED